MQAKRPKLNFKSGSWARPLDHLIHPSSSTGCELLHASGIGNSRYSSERNVVYGRADGDPPRERLTRPRISRSAVLDRPVGKPQLPVTYLLVEVRVLALSVASQSRADGLVEREARSRVVAFC